MLMETRAQFLFNKHKFKLWQFIIPVLCPVEKVRSQWDSTQNGVEARLQQLDRMISHSDQWEELRRKAKALTGQSETRLHNLLQLSREPLTKQISDNKVRPLTCEWSEVTLTHEFLSLVFT